MSMIIKYLSACITFGLDHKVYSVKHSHYVFVYYYKVFQKFSVRLLMIVHIQSYKTHTYFIKLATEK